METKNTGYSTQKSRKKSNCLFITKEKKSRRNGDKNRR